MPKFIDKFKFVFQQNPFPFILYPAFLKKLLIGELRHQILTILATKKELIWHNRAKP